MIDSSSWTAYFQHFGQFFNGFLFTIAIALGSFTLAMLLGILFGILSTSKHGSLRILSRIFVEFYQNTPLLVQFVIVVLKTAACPECVLARGARRADLATAEVTAQGPLHPLRGATPVMSRCTRYGPLHPL